MRMMEVWNLRIQSENESHSVVSDSLQLRGLYSPWSSPGQNTGVGSLSLLLGIFSAQGLNPGLPAPYISSKKILAKPQYMLPNSISYCSIESLEIAGNRHGL